jgi:hypothetical protein
MLVSLLFRDFIDCSPHALQLRVLLPPRAPIRLSKLASLQIASSQPPLHVRNCRLKPNDFDVIVLRNEFGSCCPSLTNWNSFISERVTCILHPDFSRCSLNCPKTFPQRESELVTASLVV